MPQLLCHSCSRLSSALIQLNCGHRACFNCVKEVKGSRRCGLCQSKKTNPQISIQSHANHWAMASQTNNYSYVHSKDDRNSHRPISAHFNKKPQQHAASYDRLIGLTPQEKSNLLRSRINQQNRHRNSVGTVGITAQHNELSGMGHHAKSVMAWTEKEQQQPSQYAPAIDFSQPNNNSRKAYTLGKAEGNPIGNNLQLELNIMSPPKMDQIIVTPTQPPRARHIYGNTGSTDMLSASSNKLKSLESERIKRRMPNGDNQQYKIDSIKQTAMKTPPLSLSKHDSHSSERINSHASSDKKAPQENMMSRNNPLNVQLFQVPPPQSQQSRSAERRTNLLCRKHNEALSLFCLSTKELVCSQCLRRDPKIAKQFLPLHEIQHLLRRQNKLSQLQADTVSLEVRKAINLIQNNVSVFESSLEKNRHEVEAIFKSIENSLEEQKQKVLAEMEQLFGNAISQSQGLQLDLKYLDTKLAQYSTIDCESCSETEMAYLYSSFRLISKTIDQLDFKYNSFGPTMDIFNQSLNKNRTGMNLLLKRTASKMPLQVPNLKLRAKQQLNQTIKSLVSEFFLLPTYIPLKATVERKRAVSANRLTDRAVGYQDMYTDREIHRARETSANKPKSADRFQKNALRNDVDPKLKKVIQDTNLREGAAKDNPPLGSHANAKSQQNTLIKSFLNSNEQSIRVEEDINENPSFTGESKQPIQPQGLPISQQPLGMTSPQFLLNRHSNLYQKLLKDRLG